MFDNSLAQRYYPYLTKMRVCFSYTPTKELCMTLRWLAFTILVLMV